jgi:hypothetical protein
MAWTILLSSLQVFQRSWLNKRIDREVVIISCLQRSKRHILLQRRKKRKVITMLSEKKLIPKTNKTCICVLSVLGFLDVVIVSVRISIVDILATF